MCLWPTVAPTACTRCLHTWTRLLWSPHPGTFLLPLKSFAPRPSYPESFMLRAGTPAIVLGTWRHYLQRGLLHPPKAEGAWSPSWTSSVREFGCLQGAGGCGREQFFTAQQTFPHSWKDTKVSAASYAAGRCKNCFTPGFQPQNLPPVSGCPAHSPPGAQRHRIPSTHLGSTPTEADGQPVWEPLGLLHDASYWVFWKLRQHKHVQNQVIFHSSASIISLSQLDAQDGVFPTLASKIHSCWPCGGHTVSLIKLEILTAN